MIGAEVIAAGALWGLLAWQAPRLQLRSPRSTYTFLTLLFLALAATTQVPSAAAALDALARLPDLGRVLQYSFALLAASSWAVSATYLAPALAPRRRWLMLLFLVGAVMGLIWAAALAQGETVREDTLHNRYSLALSAVAHAYLLMVTVTFSLPALAHTLRTESAPQLRYRLWMLTSAHSLIGIWMVTSLVTYALIALGVLPRTLQSPFPAALMLAVLLAYGLAFLPTQAALRIARFVNQLHTAWRCLLLRRLQTRIGRLLAEPAPPLPVGDLARSPEFALYTTVIAILDRRKALHASPNPQARRIAKALDAIGRSDQGYTSVLNGLARLAAQI